MGVGIDEHFDIVAGRAQMFVTQRGHHQAVGVERTDKQRRMQKGAWRSGVRAEVGV